VLPRRLKEPFENLCKYETFIQEDWDAYRKGKRP